MKFTIIKITGFLTIMGVAILSSCEIEEFALDPVFANDGKFLFQTEKTYCNREPENEIWSKSFKYDKNSNLTETTNFYNETPDSKTTTTFNSNNQPLTDSIFYFAENRWKLNNSTEYIYSRNLLSEKKRFEADGTNTHKTVYKYIGTTPKWEEFYYYTDNQWKFQYAHGFEFDRNGRLIKKSSYQTAEKDKVYDTFIYAYKNGKLVEEKRIIRTGEISYINKFTYTSEGLPFETIQNKNIIEKNFYTNGRLTEKHTFYFGIDPGFSQCNGNLIYKYGY